MDATIGVAFATPEDARSRRPAARRGCRDVSGQARGARHVSFLPRGNGRRPEGARAAGDRSARRRSPAARSGPTTSRSFRCRRGISSASRCSRAGTARTTGRSRRTIFIPVAEETGMIGDLFYGVLRQACSDARELAAASATGGQHLADATAGSRDCPPRILGILTETGFRAGPPRGRDHRDGADQRPRSGAHRARRRCRISASRSRWTISAPAIPASTTCGNCASTSSRSTAATSPLSSRAASAPSSSTPSSSSAPA